MAKYYVDCDEYYPYYSLHDEEWYDYYCPSVELSKEDLKDYTATMEKFVSWQNRLANLHKERYKDA